MPSAVVVMVPDGSYQTSTIDPHVTLLYAGDVEDLQPYQIEIMKGIASDIADLKPYYATDPNVTGRGCFRIDPKENDGNSLAYVDLIDWNVFPAARKLVETRAGFVDKTHGFLPHMTLFFGSGWLPESAEPGPKYSFKWASVDLWMGDERIVFPIS